MKKSEMNKEAYPVAYIAKNKQRVKQYNNSVYLKNNDEFMIELFNPTRNKVLAKITVNGNSIFSDSESGLIVKPGERIYLERFLSDSKKFKFRTYNVDGNDEEVLNAIAENGDVVIKFYKEKNTQVETTYATSSFPNNSYLNVDMSKTNGIAKPFFCNTTTTNDFCKMTTTNGTITTNLNEVKLPERKTLLKLSCDSNNIGGESFTSCYTNKVLHDNIIETGLIEKGSYSNQKFNEVYGEYDKNYSWISEWKILPESRKNIVSEDIIQYCSNCGRKKRQKENFCPKCGFNFNKEN